MTPRSVVIHSHFYQPPRENPWTDRVPQQESAAPFANWNERITAESYQPLTEARILDSDGKIREVVNTLEWMSWDAGPTLLRWLAREAPRTYAAFIEADRRSAARLGHGNAIASPYHHVILPLASRRDRVTEVRWGLEDFRRRFGREATGMWLPETAVDMESLEVLAQEGVAFTILGPGQVVDAPPGGAAGRVDLGGGRSIGVFVYDGDLSHGVAFGSLLGDSRTWVSELLGRTEAHGARLVSLAADGETFGHHHKWSDMALAATLVELSRHRSVRLDNFASYLARHGTAHDVTVIEPSAWSCAHGVDRWKRDCGCKIAPHIPSQQAWRGVLRDSLEGLAERVHARFEREAGQLFDDPWAVRDSYGSVLDRGKTARRTFVREAAGTALDDDAADTAVSLLESERDALRMFTSCGWFFDDLAGLEPLQNLRYAAHAIDLAGAAGTAWESELREALAIARSNDPEAGDGKRLWDTEVVPNGMRGPAPLPGQRGIESARGALESSVRTFLRAPTQASAQAVFERAGQAPEEHVQRARVLFREGAERGSSFDTPLLGKVGDALGFGSEYLASRMIGGTDPVSFVFCLHLHQPVGNFDSVFEEHTNDVYLPFLKHLAERDLLPVSLHVSGPLLLWLDAHAHDFLDLIGRLASDGAVELLLSGLYEPVLPALSRNERADQIGWMHEWLESKFGVDASGLWLTERVWEPDLVEDLHAAGVEYAFVDDRHFRVAGVERGALYQPHLAESGGRHIRLLPIAERLRYLVPFRPATEIEDYFRSLYADEQRLAVLADDGEKFGGWPGTAEWVWQSGWLDDFSSTLSRLVDDGVIRLRTGHQASSEIPSAGPTWLPSASYREMEAWSLPTRAAIQLESVVHSVPDEADSFVRGGHWRNFFAIYPESARMHRKARLLEALSERTEVDAAEAEAIRHALGRARCNDVYWHGVFGGLYLRHLREAIWRNLADAERRLRIGAPMTWEVTDVVGNGRDDVWVHSEHFSAAFAPDRGGALVDFTSFSERRNYGDVLTRHWESYHRPSHPSEEGEQHSSSDDAGMPSIHDLEETLSFGELPPVDPETRTMTAERVLTPSVTAETFAAVDYDALRSWTSEPMPTTVRQDGEDLVLSVRSEGSGRLEKEVRIAPTGRIRWSLKWDPGAFPPDALFSVEVSLSEPLQIGTDGLEQHVWSHEIRTVSKSERGSEESVQGYARTVSWPCAVGSASFEIDFPV